MSSTHRVAPRRPWLGSCTHVFRARAVGRSRIVPAATEPDASNRAPTGMEPLPCPPRRIRFDNLRPSRLGGAFPPRESERSTYRIGSDDPDVRLEAIRGILSIFPIEPSPNRALIRGLGVAVWYRARGRPDFLRDSFRLERRS